MYRSCFEPKWPGNPHGGFKNQRRSHSQQLLCAGSAGAMVMSDSETESETDVPDPICKSEPGMSAAEQQQIAELLPREVLQLVVAFACIA